MARKQTYRERFSNKIIDSDKKTVIPAAKEKIPLNPNVQLIYSEGKVLLIDKPLHWTSFDVVRKLRRLIQIKKIGHAGTLDPLASGLLIVCTGKFTKRINEFMAQEKEYTGSITLGAVTPTYDLESEPQQHKDFSMVTEELLLQIKKKFIGEIQQLPPKYSAIKKDGVALYELARRGEDVELKPRNITIHSFEITGIALPQIQFKVCCSTGTYIRSLANDFGAALGCGGYLSSLRRTRIGNFLIDEAITINDFEKTIQQQLAE